MPRLIPSIRVRLIIASGAVAVTAASGIRALSVPPSEYFAGDDGQWSTFFLQIGSPWQTVHVLPGTSASPGNVPWVVLDEGCSQANPNLTNCAGLRGGTFLRNLSTSWSTQRLANGGLFSLVTYEESMLGLSGNAYYGFDTVQLGTTGSGLPTVPNQLIAGIATNNFFVGSLGLSPLAFNFTDLNSPFPSLLSNLVNHSVIPSLVWAYSAGAAYLDNPVFGSLTLGGYDQSRFNASNTLTNIAFGADISRDLIVYLQSITYDTAGSSPLLAKSIPIFIDSMVTPLWLPIPVCDAFQNAFNLTWNDTLGLYLVDDGAHAALVAQNPVFEFTLAANASGGGTTVSIRIPYAAFDLTASEPLWPSGSQRYFPLRRAENASQYTLGRVFLQGAYVIADYDRHHFSVAQALFPGPSEPSNLVTINPFDILVTSNRGLSAGAISGIAVAGAVLLGLCAVAIVVLTRRRRHQKSKLGADTQPALLKPPETDQKEQLDDNSRPELDNTDALRNELEHRTILPRELSTEGAVKARYPELPGAHGAFELEARDQRRELEGSEPAKELPQSSTTGS